MSLVKNYGYFKEVDTIYISKYFQNNYYLIFNVKKEKENQKTLMKN